MSRAGLDGFPDWAVGKPATDWGPDSKLLEPHLVVGLGFVEAGIDLGNAILDLLDLAAQLAHVALDPVHAKLNIERSWRC